MKYRLVIFDWDGTLMDSTGRIVHCMQAAARDLSLDPLSGEEVRGIIGLGLPEAILNLWPQLDERGVSDMRERYAHHFILAESEPSRLYPGVADLVSRLHRQGMLLAVATGKSRKGLERVWRGVSFSGLFHASRCADETRSKPHPAMVLELLTQLGVGADEAVVVGDTTFDLEMAQRAGVDRVGVAWGAHEEERLAQFSPLAILDTIHELPRVLGMPSRKQTESA